MTGPWTIRETGMVAGAVLLMLVAAYCQGKKAGQLDEKLSSNKTAIHASDSSTKSVQIRTDSAHNRSDLLTDNRATLRGHVHIVHDTISFEPDTTGDGEQQNAEKVVNAQIARLIFVDDSTIHALQRTVALQDTLLAAKNVGIGLRDQRIKLLESRGTQRFSKGLQVGVGYCQTASSRQPCVYVGYGIQIGLP